VVTPLAGRDTKGAWYREWRLVTLDGSTLDDWAELAKHRPILCFGDQNLTLADAHGLVIMREQKTVMCWSTDRRLALMGQS
jgi:hypothetical protein